ncbi:hypothetical protein INR49_002448, partial [Caranx melampygus]
RERDKDFFLPQRVRKLRYGTNVQSGVFSVRKAVVCVLLLSGLCSCRDDYHIVRQGKTWHEARNYCRNKYNDLARIDNEEDMGRLREAAGSGFSGTVWIGLHDVWDWRWSMGNRKAGYTSWKKGEPNDRIQHLSCVYYQDHQWIDAPCSEELMFVCFSETSADSSTNGNYIFRREILPWSKALEYCRNHYTDLAIVRNQTENDMVQQVIPPNYWVWIGLSRLTWRWTDGASKFRSWAEGHPRDLSSNCVSMVVHEETWVERLCDTKMYFMCQSNKKQLYRAHLTALQSTIDLNDNKVKDAILNLIREKLKERGLLRDVRVEWVKKPGLKIFHKEVLYRGQSFDIPT